MPYIFERLLEAVLAGLHWEIRLIYLNDMITFGKTFDEAVGNLQQVLERLRKCWLAIRTNVMRLLTKSVSFLGHIISDEGVAIDPER